MNHIIYQIVATIILFLIGHNIGQIPMIAIGFGMIGALVINNQNNE